jgi:hypothetical protein
MPTGIWAAGHEVDRRKQAKVVGTEPQFCRQWDRHDRVDSPKQIGDVMALPAAVVTLNPATVETLALLAVIVCVTALAPEHW